MQPSFIHLRVRSPYSLLKGAVRIPDLLSYCKRHLMPAVAITDHDNLFGSLEFSQVALKQGVQPIIGATFSVVPQEYNHLGGSFRAEQADELLLIAKDEIGYSNLLKLASLAYMSAEYSQPPLLSYQTIATYAKGLICLTAGLYGGVGKALAFGRYDYAESILLTLQDTFNDRLYIELMRHGDKGENLAEQGSVDLAYKYGIPVVATNNCYFIDADMLQAHDALLCVSHGTYVAEEDRAKSNENYRLKTPQEMCMLFADIPEAIDNTSNIAKRCSVFSPSRAPILPGFHIKNEEGEVLSESDALCKAAQDGLQVRLEAHVYKVGMSDTEKADIAAPYLERLEYELDVIITMKFPGYFLIVSDFIIWAKEQGIPVGPGRGSGAGSVVAWALLITDLDPLQFGLIFERFLNPERVSMPDFDIDFCQDRRDEVIKYVQQKYGHDKVAQIITFGKLQARAVLRDVGRVLQMPYGQVDRICKMVPNNPANPVTLKEAIELESDLRHAIKEDETVEKLTSLSLQLEGLYRHASTHAAGVVIGDRPLHELVPMYRDPKSDMLVVQYSMKYAEGAGLVKFDFLGLKTLSVIQKALEFIAKSRGKQVDLSILGYDDAVTYEMLGSGETMGVFQFESAGMRDALRKLQPDCLDDLIALGALYRPGPMDNIPTYIARKHGKQEPDYLHPMLEDVLRETYGVIIYQEQVQKIAQVMAGYTLGGADLLRRAMGKKIKAEMDAQRTMFVEGAEKNGVDKEQASSIFDLVAKFAGYGFNKSHAAAYAVIAYHTAYLKANYPVEFLAASMNYDLNNTDKLGLFKQEAERCGIAILPPDINTSETLFSVEKREEGLAIRYGLAAIKNVGEQAMESLCEERSKVGDYKSISDFAHRIDGKIINRRQLEYLIQSGAFDTLHMNRKELFENIDLILGISSQATKDRESCQENLFGNTQEEQLAEIALKKYDDWDNVKQLQKEYAALGFYFSAHPLATYNDMLLANRVVSSGDFSARLGENYVAIKTAGIVTGKKIKMSKKGKFAFLQLSDCAGSYEVSIFDEALLSSKAEQFENGQMLLIHCEGKKDEMGVRLIAKSIALLDESAQHYTLPELKLEIEGAKTLKHLQENLGKIMTEGTQIVLYLKIDEQQLVVIKMPEYYHITSETLMEINNINGVTRR